MRKKNPTYLLSLVQGKTEPLKDYMQRFNWEKLTIESPNELMVLSALMNGIRTEGPLMAELARRLTLGTLRQFMGKAKEFINQEETIKALTKAKAEDPQGCPNNAKREGESSSRKKRKSTRSPKAYEKKFEPFRRQSQSYD
jgi:hypothetical protein